MEQTRLSRSIYNNHHSNQQTECIEVNVMNSRILVHDTEQDHQDGAAHSKYSAMNLLRDD
ncbi:hypothetical protein D3C73_1480090 [compost metagenome]